MDGLEFRPSNHKNFKAKEEGFKIPETIAATNTQNFTNPQPGNQQAHSTPQLILPKQPIAQENPILSQPLTGRKNSQAKNANIPSLSNGSPAITIPRPLKPKPKEIKPRPVSNKGGSNLGSTAPVYINGMYIDPKLLNQTQNSFASSSQNNLYTNLRPYIQNIPNYSGIGANFLPIRSSANGSFAPIAQQNPNFPQFFNHTFSNNTNGNNTSNTIDNKKQRTGSRQSSDLPPLAPNIQPGYNSNQANFVSQQVNPNLMQKPFFSTSDTYNTVSKQFPYNMLPREQPSSSNLPNLANGKPVGSSQKAVKAPEFVNMTTVIPLNTDTPPIFTKSGPENNNAKASGPTNSTQIPICKPQNVPPKLDAKALTTVFDSKPPKLKPPTAIPKEPVSNLNYPKNMSLAPKPAKHFSKFPEIAPKKVESPPQAVPSVTQPTPCVSVPIRPSSDLPAAPFKDEDGFYVPTSLPIKGLDKSPSAISPIPIGLPENPLKRAADELLNDPVDRSFKVSPIAACQLPYQINGLGHTRNMRWVVLGSDDGFIRKYDFFDSLNGKLPLTASQRHATIDVCNNAGVMVSYWDNQLHPSSSPLPSSTMNEFDSRFSPVLALYLHSKAVWCLSGQNNGDVNLSTVRFDEGKCHVALKGHTSTVSVIKPIEDETKAVSGSWDKTVKIWDLNTGDKIHDLAWHINQISSVNSQPINGSSQSSSLLLTTSIDGRSSLWDLRDPSRPQFQLEPPAGCPKWATSSCFNVVGDTIYTGRRNHSVDCFDLRKMAYIRTLKLPRNSGSVGAVAFHPTRNFLAIGSFDNFRMWNLDHLDDPRASSSFLAPFQLVPGHQFGTISQIAFDSTGKYVITTSGNRGWEGSSTNFAIFYEVKFH